MRPREATTARRWIDSPAIDGPRRALGILRGGEIPAAQTHGERAAQ